MSNQPLDNRLDRFRNLIVTPQSGAQSSSSGTNARYRRLADALGADLVSTGGGAYCLKTTLFPMDYSHGTIRVDELKTTTEWPASAFTAHETEGSVSAGKILYLDTETTGLGGAGVVPFLVGTGEMTERGFEVKQYVIPDYDDESAMLEALLASLEGRSVMTYNGATFDLPLLRDRFIINRVHKSYQFDPCYDLLQATRRLFKRRIKDCSLGNVERELLGFTRDDDVPGYLIPSIYFDWLSSENVTQLPGVLEHNLYDIVSLHFLAFHIARIFGSDGEALDQVDDLYSLTRVYHRRNDRERTHRLCERLDSESAGLSPDIRLFRAFTLKKASQWPEAASIFEELARLDTREAYWANLELAKYFEHSVKDYHRSLECALRAGSQCPVTPAEKEALTYRIARLRTRLGR
jgi:uncharacterized protein